MGLDVGIIAIKYLERPRGRAYDFAWELAIEASASGYMHGDGNNWGAFTQRQMLHMLDDFAETQRLDASTKAEILAWVRSLPWDGWQDNLAPRNITHADDYNPVIDSERDEEAGLIELHFNW